MSDLFDGIEPFVAVAREGSFRGAAQSLGVTPAAVSKAIQRLERRLGVVLFQRTTRRVALTLEGSLYLERCQEAVAQIRAGRDILAMHQGQAQGDVTLTMPHILGRFLMRRLSQFTNRFPRLRLHLRFTDKYVDLVEERGDVALRIGQLEDSTMIARFLRQTRWCTVASPEYMAQHDTPQRPEDLQDHRCLKFVAPDGQKVEWLFLQRDAKGGEKSPALVKTPTFLDVDQGEMLIEACLMGVGIAQVFAYLAEEHIQAGRLVEILREDAAPGLPIHALCMPGQQHNPRIRALLDFLVESFTHPSR